MRNLGNISDLYEQVKLNEGKIKERKLTDAEKDKLKKLEKEVPMKDFKDRYGKEGEAVYYATLTKMAKKEGFASDAQRRAAFAQGYKAKGKKGKKEETELDEAKYQVNYSKNNKLFSKTVNAKNEDDAEEKFLKMMAMKKINITDDDIRSVVKEEIDIQEDGHVDVASAVRQCKTITEDAMQMLQKLQTMSPEDALPTWWTNKLAVASNSMNKMRDYLLVPSVSEEVELEEDMTPDEIERDAKKAMSQFNSDMAKIYPSSKYFARATTAPMGGGIAFEFAVIPTSQAKGVDLRNAPAHSKFMMHLTDGFGKKVPLSKVSIQQIMGRLPTKFRKITARTPTDAVSKMVDFFKKNKSDFESLVKEEVELDEQFDFVLLDKDNKIVARASGKNAKKEMESSKKSAHLPPMRIPKGEVSKMKVYPISPKDKKDIGDMVLAIGEEKNHIKEMIESGKFTRTEIKKMIKRNILEQSSDFFKKARMKAGLPPTPTARSATGYELFHKTFSGAMQHAYAMAKKNMGMTVDPKEIDSKVATGPKKPGTGKTNSYSLKTNKGMLQIQVYNRGGSKPFELNMYSS